MKGKRLKYFSFYSPRIERKSHLKEVYMKTLLLGDSILRFIPQDIFNGIEKMTGRWIDSIIYNP